MITKMGWTYSEAGHEQTRPQAREQAIAKIDHAFDQLLQMKEGRLQGINADELLNEL